MSFDFISYKNRIVNLVSIPLEQGNVFRLNLPLTLTADRLVSIPLEQGNVFRLKENVQVFNGSSVSIPLEQGNVFRQPNILYG